MIDYGFKVAIMSINPEKAWITNSASGNITPNPYAAYAAINGLNIFENRHIFRKVGN
ncbi:hypothetical protein RLOatenuis_1320 [Rickettsiales bacterium]|nr:hypothetical protein RLOatenuis_1320 [Rickettsiales bacterium]